MVDKIDTHFNIGHLVAAECDTVSPDGKYLIAMNKWALDRFLPVGPLLPQNIQLIDISGPKMQLLYDMPLPLGEPPFAAQLTDTSGQTFAFDDTGCLFLYLDEHRPTVHSIYFHHYQQDRWIAAEKLAFVKVEVTPMGFGLGAVDAGTADAISLDAARQHCLSRLGDHGGKQ